MAYSIEYSPESLEHLRITNYRKRAVIAFAVDGKQVFIIGIYYGGQDFETALLFEPDD